MQSTEGLSVAAWNVHDSIIGQVAIEIVAEAADNLVWRIYTQTHTTVTLALCDYFIDFQIVLMKRSRQKVRSAGNTPRGVNH